MKSSDIHPLAALRAQAHRPIPSDAAIAKAFWGRSHCQYHDAENCQFVEDIISDAELIEAGEPSFYDFETARYNAMQPGTDR